MLAFKHWLRKKICIFKFISQSCHFFAEQCKTIVTAILFVLSLCKLAYLSSLNGLTWPVRMQKEYSNSLDLESYLYFLFFPLFFIRNFYQMDAKTLNLFPQLSTLLNALQWLLGRVPLYPAPHSFFNYIQSSGLLNQSLVS